MNCNEVKPLLDPLIDGLLEAKDAALVLDHMQTCVDCHAEWQDIEKLHADFKKVKDRAIMPPGMMDRISKSLQEEKKSAQSPVFSPAFTLSIAAALFVVGLMIMPVLTGSLTAPVAVSKQINADTLIAQFSSSDREEKILDRKQLEKSAGFDMKQVKLPDWSLVGSAVSEQNDGNILARFDYVSKSSSGKLSCYQGRKGSIKAGGRQEILAGKAVTFGSSGRYNFALFSQNDRDYLFITELSTLDLKDAVAGA